MVIDPRAWEASDWRRLLLTGAVVSMLLLGIIATLQLDAERYWLLAQFAYIPVLLGAYRYGLRGGLAAGMLAAVLAVVVLRPLDIWTIVNGGLFLASGAIAGSAKVIYDRHLDIEKAATRNALDLVELRDMILASVSHEMRNSLTSVVGLSQTLLESLRELSTEEIEELVELIAQEGKDLAAMVEDLLVTAKVEQGNIEVRRDPIDLSRVAAQVVHAMQFDDVELDLADAAPAVGDEVRVRQILRNLISNAKRYGGQHIAVRIERVDGSISLCVADDGPGVPAEDIEFIFDAFHRARTTTVVTASVGLGLAVSRKLAERMGGALEYSRDEGESVFRLSLPAGEVDAPALSRQWEESGAA